jgi:hypothetical protein
MGGKPTHPELLDWLASQILDHDWKLKPIHKMIMLSKTYRQSSVFREASADVDSDDRFYWRFSPRRLSAEEIRDTVLNLAGVLDLKTGGPGFRLYRYIQDNVATYIPREQLGPETYRRAVYHQNARAALVDLMTDFDCPDNAFAAPRRASTTTPLQALTMMNHSFTMDMASSMAERIQIKTSSEDLDQQVRQLFENAYLRHPSQEEASRSVQFIQDYGLQAFCRAMLNSNELIYLN